MHKGIKKPHIAIAMLLFLGTLLAMPPSEASAYENLPVLIRIGLYFNSSSAANQAAASYSLYCEGGISMGYLDRGNKYNYIYDFMISDIKSPMTVSAYSFGKKYAVITGRDAGSFAEVSKRVDGLRKKGYSPLLAYSGGWVLIVGLYGSDDAARQEIDSGLSKNYPNYSFASEDVSGKYILVTVGGVRHFIFDTAWGDLRASPMKKIADGIPPLISINDKQYRGGIDFIMGTDGTITAANIILLEQYLYGVVPREIDASGPAEAVKAQAVAARTFAVTNIGRHGSHGFDLCDTTHCQAYSGFAREDPRSTAAVDETVFKIVTYDGLPAHAFYFDSSGGHTENVKNVWGIEYPYLAGVEDNYESGDSYHYDWEAVYTAQEIKERLAQGNVKIGDITGVAVTKTSAAGRAIEVTVYGTEGTKVYNGESCRTFLGNLHSQMYAVFASSNSDPSGAGSGKSYTAIGSGGTRAVVPGGSGAVGAGGNTVKLAGNGGAAISGSGISGLAARGTTFRFVGRGWGHGVGMSQEGAKGMARAGFTCEEIIAHYFPGCTMR